MITNNKKQPIQTKKKNRIEISKFEINAYETVQQMQSKSLFPELRQIVYEAEVGCQIERFYDTLSNNGDKKVIETWANCNPIDDYQGKIDKKLRINSNDENILKNGKRLWNTFMDDYSRLNRSRFDIWFTHVSP